jgi:hypothetical protein
MGGLEVSLAKQFPNELDLQHESIAVRYMSPFFGSTAVRHEGTNSADFNDVQKSYGFWAVPPDIGTSVVCMFINGQTNDGFWIGCVPDQFQNHMVPGIAASQFSAMTADQERKYGTRNLPVGEFLKKTRDLSNPNPDVFTKPIHPFADRLLAQGLLADNIRGVTSSSARREVPSMVFGISTPGPLDQNGKYGPIGFGQGGKKVPVSRLGGSTFVMDDGDKDGENELVRIRTRTGHQILLHNSHDLIYIANGQGTAWIELTGNGKIDIYAADSVSIHTEADFNFRADRDVNIEAGRNLNIAVGGNMQADVNGDYTLIVNNDGKIAFSGTYDHTVDDDYKLTISGDSHVGAGGNMLLTAIENYNVKAGQGVFNTANEVHLKAGEIFNDASKNVHIKAVAQILQTAAVINVNGAPAGAAKESTAASSADVPSALPLYNLPNASKSAGWDDGRFYKADDISSIMRRVPTHEPWAHHESINAAQFTQAATDVKANAQTASQAGSVGVGTARPNSAGTVSDPNRNYNRADIPADWTQDAAFIKKVKEVAKNLKCDYIDLLACMAFETGRTFDPGLRNSIGATGLIQFIRPTARALGTTTDELAAMSRVEQMDWVELYFKKGPVAKLSAPTIEDLYMAILWPAAVGKGKDYVLFATPTLAYQQNAGLDINKDGNVTAEEAAGKARAQINYVRTQLSKIPAEGGVVTDGSGKPIVDGSGNPVRYGPPANK